MVGKIFISYRREDGVAHAGRIRDRLEREFGLGHVFMDLHDILPGEKFAEYLREEIPNCDVMLAVMGPRWLDRFSKDRTPRRGDLNDFVYMEIIAALQHDIPIVPILLNETKFPEVDQLPQGLEGLARRNGLHVRDDSFARDMDRLIHTIHQIKKPPLPPLRPKWIEVIARIVKALAPPPIPRGIPQLHEGRFWRERSEKTPDGKRAVFLTVVLPTGRAEVSTAAFLALASDALAVPEVCVELSRVVRRTAGLDLQVSTVLDIDLIEEPKSTPSCLSCKNLLLLGTPDINEVTAQVAEISGGLADPKNHRPGFSHRDSCDIRDAKNVNHTGRDEPGYGLFGMYENPWFVSKNDGRQKSRCVALVCGGCGVAGTIAATKFLLEALRNRKKATNSPHNSELAVRFMEGTIRSYDLSVVKPAAKCVPPVEVSNVDGFKMRD